MGRVIMISFILLVTLTAKVHSRPPHITTPYIFNIREDTPVGEFAFQITAMDPEGDTLVYGLSGPDANFFSADEKTGKVTVRLSLDRETKQTLFCDVTVTDNVNLPVSRSVSLNLIDCNDNFPIFQETPYNVIIPENTPIGSSVLSLTARDADQQYAGLVYYSITGVSPPDGQSLFDIDGMKGVISLKGELSFTEKSSFYQLTVKAKDGGGPLGDDSNYIQESSTFVSITVEDVPDLAPQFFNLPNAATVTEGAPVGTEVYTVRARDPDTGVSSPIQYSITNSSVDGLFQINPNSGVITVQSNLLREHSGGVVTLEIEAKETELDVNGVNAVANSDLQIIITRGYGCVMFVPESTCLQSVAHRKYVP